MLPTPFGFAVRRVPPDRPWAWLAAGWDDLRAAPLAGFLNGAAVVAAGWVLVSGLLSLGMAWAVPPAIAGFLLIGPLCAAGLYEVSRRRAAGLPLRPGDWLDGFARNGSQIALVGLALLLLHIVWVQVAALLFMAIFGLGFAPPIEHLPMALLRSPRLLPFLILGTGAGAVLAAIAFALSAVSIPLLVDRDAGAVTAMTASVQAVRANPGPMLFWAGLIVVFTAMALVPFFLGLALVVPLVAHASWHAYRDLILWDAAPEGAPAKAPALSRPA
ncbi:DUF2189 domain-containing protein [Roseomonas sp. OT10]|uniref:DUF2189 domain-containing protein n=1 Tax=Roseomonas cutis TaxID=2897332 RepID=UPI001E36DAFC|nr:DUF2189 domain-containing protein [Roseomonas sp. OT10]UFN48627.1 DUF2189 domain-containing protein [Roseomonas sp. OT10]